MRDRDLTNVQFPMLNSYPNRGRPHESERLRIAHWELNIGQILGLMRSSGYCQVIFAQALSCPAAVFAGSYFLVYFFKSMRNSAPYTLPWASTATPSAMLEPADRDPGAGQPSLYGYGAGSGMKYFTEPSRALPIRMPRRTPGSYP